MNSSTCFFALVQVVTFAGATMPNSTGITAPARVAVISDGLASYQVSFFRRRNLISQPIITGTLYDSPSKKPLAALAMVVFNGSQVRADATGYYQKEISPGAYKLVARNIFYKNLTIQKLSVAAGDSLVVNFYLQGEATMN